MLTLAALLRPIASSKAVLRRLVNGSIDGGAESLTEESGVGGLVEANDEFGKRDVAETGDVAELEE